MVDVKIATIENNNIKIMSGKDNQLIGILRELAKDKNDSDLNILIDSYEEMSYIRN